MKTPLIGVEGTPAEADLHPRAWAELQARIAFAKEYGMVTADEDVPDTIEVWVLETDGEGEDMSELAYKFIPANATGMYGSWPAPTPEDPHHRGTDARWFQVQCRWDGAESSIVVRDFTGTFEHWM